MNENIIRISFPLNLSFMYFLKYILHKNTDFTIGIGFRQSSFTVKKKTLKTAF